MNKIELDINKLYEMYVVKEMSTKKIALELGVGKNTVNRHLQKNNIPLRDKKSAQKTAMKKWGENKKAQNEECNLKCENCGKDIYVKKSLLDKSEKHFCSTRCSSLFYKAPWRKTGQVINCTNCNKEFYRNKYNIENFDNHFCSKKCNNEWLKENAKKGEEHPRYNQEVVYCSYCGEPKMVNQFKLNQKYHYCNVDCMSKHFVGLVCGENHPQWKGGGLYYGPNWKKVRAEARERDNYTCQRCGLHEDELGHALPVHHIVPLREHDSWVEANVLSNLVSLCPRCHGIVEQHGMDFEFVTS